MQALIIVDVQNDFAHKNGSLYVKGSEQIYSAIDTLVKRAKKNNWIIICTKDYHPINHSSFKSNGGIWPDHCVQGTWGCQFSKELIDIFSKHNATYEVVSKGMNSDQEQYSGVTSEMTEIIEKNDIHEVYVCGLATDYCVFATASDLSFNISTNIVIDACKHVSNDNLELFMKECSKKYIAFYVADQVFDTYRQEDELEQ